MVDSKVRRSQMVEAGSNPVLRHIPHNSSDTYSCHPFMKLNKGKTTIGRHPNNDFLIDSSTLKNFISRWHCKIESCHLADGKITYRIFDCSLNGTFVNDYRLSKEGCVLKNGDKVIFGHLNGSNIKAGSFAPQTNSVFQYVFQNCEILPKNKSSKYIWSSPCCKKGKKCSAVHKKKLIKFCSPKVKKMASSGKDSKTGELAKKNRSLSVNNADKRKISSVDTSKQIRQQKEISMQSSTDFGFGKYCDSSDTSEGSDTSLLDKVKLSVESFGVSDSDVLDSSDSPSKGS